MVLMHAPNLNESRLLELQRELLRLRTGETLAKSNEWLAPISSDDISRVSAIGSAGIFCGCNVQYDQVISTNPEVRGVVFTRHGGPLPALEIATPEGHG
jgi:hypothetical protein